MSKENNICIFCSSSNNIDKIYFNEAGKIAELLSKNNYSLIFGGGMVGLMGEIARVFKSNKKKVISVIPKKLNKKGIVFEGSDEIIETDTMSERKTIMEKMSDSFIALPGGFGTFEEILEIITLKQLGYHNKPVGILNTAGFYNLLFKQFEELYNKNFIDKSYKELYFNSNIPSEIAEYINNYKPAILEKKLPFM